MQPINGHSTPRAAGVHGSTQAGEDAISDPRPTEPPAPQPPDRNKEPGEPAAPFPGEPGDVPAAQPEPGESAPGEPERAVPRQDPESGSPNGQPRPEDPKPLPQAAAAFVRLSAAIDGLSADVGRLLNRNMRQELALHAALIGASSQLNFVANAVGRLDADDWRNFRDLAADLRRQARELAAALDPVCEAQAKPRLAAVG